MLRATRWSDNDHNFGPFTFAYSDKYRPWAIILKSSGDEDPVEFSTLRISLGPLTGIVTLPPIVRPWKRKVAATGWNAATVERLGRDWYYDITPREYGVSYGDGFLQLALGIASNDSSTEQRWSCFLPWTQWRHVRHSFYGLQGEHLYDEVRTNRLEDWQERRAREDAVPVAKFAFKDFDGADLIATTKIEEREWRFGVGYFKWLSIFRRPKISRSLDLRFSDEVGPEKGSWKGGTIGHSIDMLPGELHEQAFRRYCEKDHRSKYKPYRITFLKAVAETDAAVPDDTGLVSGKDK